jgi:hypothetical protein
MSWTEYNANTWTSSDLITDVRRRARLSNDDQDYTDTVILREASDCIWDMPARIEVAARRGRKIMETTRSVTSEAITTGGGSYALPPMASADAISSVFWVDANTGVRRLQVVSADQEPEYKGNATDTGDATAYALFDREIRLYPTPVSSSGSLRIVYARRHPALVPSTSVRAVTTIATASAGAATKFTLASAPPAEIAVGAWIDISGYRVPHRVFYPDAVVTAVSGSDVTVSVAYATMAAACDSTAAHNYMQPSGSSYFVQLPLEFRKALGDMVAANIMRQKGDRLGAADAELASARSMQDQADFLSSRTKGSKPRIKNNWSLMRSHSKVGWRS